MKITRRCFLCLAAGFLYGCSRGDDSIGEAAAELSADRTFDVSSLGRDDVSLYLEANKKLAEKYPNTRIVLFPALHYSKIPSGRVRCELCPRFCELDESERGLCNTRINQGGELFTLSYGLANPGAYHTNLKEMPLHFHGYKKPMMSIGLVGCGLHCKQCLFGDLIFSRPEELGAEIYSPEDVVRFAKDHDCSCITHTNVTPQ